MRELLGCTLGHYRILSEIGRGGMGVVYRAHDERLDRDVAIKVLPEGVADDPDRLARFEREARAVAKLDHPNILAIHDFGSEDGVAYAVMELLEGESLRTTISGDGLTPGNAIKYAQATAEGLAAAHDKGIVHRDLKPDNIFLTTDGRIKILDFGLAKLMAPEGDPSTEAATATLVTSPGALLGTVAYMSPEQVRGETCDRRTDIFSFGAVLYEMLCGRRPFGGNSTVEIATAILGKDPQPISPITPDVPPALANIVMRCLEKRPDARFSSAHDLSLMLGALDSDSPAPRVAEKPGIIPRWPHILAVAIAVVIGLLVVLPPEGLWQRLSGRPNGNPIRSIAVLPLENLSGDPEQEYFADGMTEALISKLAQIGSLDVISKTSVMLYKGADTPLPRIAKELGVDAILEGSVMRADDAVRITVQLIDGATDRHLWADSYHRELRDVLFLQSDVAEAVADAVDVAITPDERERLTRSRPVDPVAHEAYLKGLRQVMTFTGEGFQRAITNFDHAIEIDPAWAPPYAGLGMVYSNMTFGADVSPRESFPVAMAAAEKAMELDDDLVIARLVMGWVAMIYDWDWRTAERELTRSIELMPASADAHQLYSYLLSALGRHDEAIIEARRASELDPLSPVVGQHLGMVLYLAGRYEDAIRQLESVIELHPMFWFSYQRLAQALMTTGDYERGLETMEHGIRLAGAGTFRSGKPTLASLYARAGRRTEALAILGELETLSTTSYVPPTDLARIQVALGDIDSAFLSLERAVEVRDADLFMLGVSPDFEPLRSDPRFDGLLRQINLGAE